MPVVCLMSTLRCQPLGVELGLACPSELLPIAAKLPAATANQRPDSFIALTDTLRSVISVGLKTAQTRSDQISKV